MLIAGCGGTGDEYVSSPPAGKATPPKPASITASVPAGEGKGKTTVAWDTGDGSFGQVFISVDGGPDSRMFAQGARGTKDADWIAGGRSYEFRLYAGKDHKQLLGKATVTRPRSGTASITASPASVPAGEGKGKTTVAWDTGDGSFGQVFVSVDGGLESRMVAQGARGTKDADWIAGGRSYEFRLYAGKDHKQLLGKATVTRPRRAGAATRPETLNPDDDSRKGSPSPGRGTGQDPEPH